MNINVSRPQGVVRAQEKEMNLNSVLIYLNVYLTPCRKTSSADEVGIDEEEETEECNFVHLPQKLLPEPLYCIFWLQQGYSYAV